MTQQNINFGSFIGDPLADTSYAAFKKAQANFTDLYSNAGTATGAGVANTIGGLPMDNPATSVATMTVNQLVQQQGDALPATVVANNSYLGTTGLFWTQADATAGGGTVNVPALFQAAAAWSSANNRPVAFPAGVYDIGATPNTITQNNVFFVFQKGSRIQWRFTTFNKQAFTVTGSRFRCMGGTWGPVADTYQDYLTSVPISAPTLAANPITTIPDIANWRTVNSYNWAGLTLFFTWQTSATQLFTQNSNVTYHDTLPVNRATGTQFATLAALQAFINAQTLVVSQSNLYLANTPHSIGCPTIASGSAISLVTIGAWTGYQVTHTPPGTTTYSTLSGSPGPQAGLARTPLTNAANAVSETATIPAPSINFLSGQPVPYFGDAIGVQGDDAILYDMELINASNARMIHIQANRAKVLFCNGYASAGTTGGEYVRIALGDGHLVFGCTMYSGDQTFQFVPGAAYTGASTNNGFGPTSNKNITNSKYVSCIGLCLAQGPTCSAINSIANSKQSQKWQTVASPSIPVGNTLSLPLAGIPSGLTVSNLKYSSAIYQNATFYAINATVTNGTSQYIATSAGTSGNGAGPTGSGGPDGTSGLVWALVSGSAGNADSIFVYANENIYSGSLVVGYSDNGTTSTLTLLPPPGQTNAIYNAITAQRYVQFIAGIPLGSMTNNIANCSWESCILYTLGGSCGKAANSDSQGLIDVSWINCTFDASYVNFALYQSSAPSTIYLQGGTYGGVSARVIGCSFIQPYSQALQAYGTLNDVVIKDNHIDGCTIGASQANESLYICGNNLLGNSAIVVENNTIWATQGTTNSPLRLGALSNTYDGIGELIPQSTYNAVIKNNRFLGIPNAVYAVTAANGGNFTLRENAAFPAVPGGSDTAQFLYAINVATGFIISTENNLTQINGAPYRFGTGIPAICYNYFDQYSPNLGTGSYPVVPSPNLPPTSSVLVVRTGALSTGSYTLPAFAGPSCTLFLTGAAVASPTLTLPTGAFAGQQILLNTNNAITGSFTVTPSTWPASTGLAANAGAVFSWDATPATWKVMGLP